MTIFRWIIGVALLIAASGGLLAFVLLVLRDEPEWGRLARRLRQWTFALALFWFNVEVWGRVVWTLVTW